MPYRRLLTAQRRRNVQAVLRWRARKKAEGLCVMCGGRRTPKSKWYCERHRLTENARALAWKMAHREYVRVKLRPFNERWRARQMTRRGKELRKASRGRGRSVKLRDEPKHRKRVTLALESRGLRPEFSTAWKLHEPHLGKVDPVYAGRAVDRRGAKVLVAIYPRAVYRIEKRSRWWDIARERSVNGVKGSPHED